MKKAEKDARMALLQKIGETLHGSGIDGTWKYEATSQGIWMRNSFHCMDQNGFYCGWADFSYFFPWASELREFKLRFHGSVAHYLAGPRKNNLRPYLEDSLVHFLPEGK